MANEANVQSGQQMAGPLKSLADLGTIQVNLVVKSIESLTPVMGNLAKTMTDMLAASINLLGSATGTAAGVLVSGGGLLLNAMGTIAITPVRIIGSLAGGLVSVTQSGISATLNAFGSVLPVRKAV